MSWKIAAQKRKRPDFIGASDFLVETGEGRLFAICIPHLLSALLVVLACNPATVNAPPNALGLALPCMDNHSLSFRGNPPLG